MIIARLEEIATALEIKSDHEILLQLISNHLEKGTFELKTLLRVLIEMFTKAN